jgi:hypothetical protein
MIRDLQSKDGGLFDETTSSYRALERNERLCDEVREGVEVRKVVTEKEPLEKYLGRKRKMNSSFLPATDWIARYRGSPAEVKRILLLLG